MVKSVFLCLHRQFKFKVAIQIQIYLGGAVVAQLASAQLSGREVFGSIFSDLTSVSTFLCSV